MSASLAEILAGLGRLNATEMERLVTLSEAARLAGVSKDTLKRNYRHKFVRLGARMWGMRLKDALMLSEGSEES